MALPSSIDVEKALLEFKRITNGRLECGGNSARLAADDGFTKVVEQLLSPPAPEPAPEQEFTLGDPAR